MKVYTITIEPTYRRPDGMFLLSQQQLQKKVPFTVKESSLISIPPGSFGGNHKHPRTEAFVTFHSELEIIWEDKNKKIHKETMMNKNDLKLFIVEPFVPHVIINNSKQIATLFEYADRPQLDVERVNLLGSL